MTGKIDLLASYENELDQSMSDLAFTTMVGDATWETSFDALFSLLVHGVRIYAEAWAREEHSGSLGSIVAAQSSDRTVALMELTLQAIGENILPQEVLPLDPDA